MHLLYQEAYWQDGRVAMTFPFKPTAEAAIAAAASGPGVVVVQSASVWTVNQIWVTPEEVLRTPRQWGVKDMHGGQLVGLIDGGQIDVNDFL